MRLLLDTSVALWFAEAHPRLTEAARSTIYRADAVFVSAVSIWEIAIKAALGKFNVDVDLVQAGLRDAGFQPLDITWQHGRAVRDLPLYHADPFDRLLVAQAMSEPLQLLTSDKFLARYSDLVTVV
ncbi:MAG: type II toxin-antitoxin system VapC family toxin [Bauldia sp.]